jgi:hypothetical protein
MARLAGAPPIHLPGSIRQSTVCKMTHRGAPRMGTRRAAGMRLGAVAVFLQRRQPRLARELLRAIARQPVPGLGHLEKLSAAFRVRCRSRQLTAFRRVPAIFFDFAHSVPLPQQEAEDKIARAVN